MLSILIFATAGCKPSSPQQLFPKCPGRYGGTLYLAISSDPRTFNPVVAQETSSTVVLNYLFDGLTTINFQTGDVVPNLAERWETDLQKLVWTFHLRPDVKWSDGQPFSADDVVFTFNDVIFNDRIINSAKDILMIGGRKIAVEKVDDHTVRFILPDPFAPFLRAIAEPILPKHKLLASVQNGTFSNTWGVQTPASELCGTGPFRLAEYRAGEYIVLRRNPYYWKKSPEGDGLPYLDSIRLVIVPSEDVTLLKFKAGEIDATSVSGKDYPLLKPLEQKGNFTVYDSGPSFGALFLAFNQNPGTHPLTGKPFVEPHKLTWFQNRSFRQAIAHALDKQQMIQIVLNGFGIPQISPLSPSSGYFFNPIVSRYDYNLETAKALLAQTGFLDRNGDGWLEDGAQHPVEFSLVTNADNKERLDMAAMIRQDLSRLGIRVTLIGLEFNAMVSKLTSTMDWEAVLLGLTGGVEPHFGANVWRSSGSLHFWYPRQVRPATEWEKRVDDLFDQAVHQYDPPVRKALYDEWQEIVAYQLPLIYTVISEQIYAVRNRFGNLKPTVLGGPFYNIEEIYVQEK